MDELTLDDKIYISSKKASEITGYAKDYIGQLAREGRIEARLVGRSWYALESAVREHRFGESKMKIEPKSRPEPEEIVEYRAENAKFPDLDPKAPQAAWEEWFEQLPRPSLPFKETLETAEAEPHSEEIKIARIANSIVKPRQKAKIMPTVSPMPRKTSAVYRSSLAVFGVVIIFFVALALVGGGFFAASYSKYRFVDVLAGVSEYNKSI